MAGHSKWANIKRRKGKADKQKGKIFSRIMKEIISAVKQGGSDPKSNTKLRVAIDKAKKANVPTDNIDRNIKKASSAEQQDYASVTYELYGHGGVGIIAEAMTDNKNRTASDMRIAINKCGGTLAHPGAVTFNFDQKGVIQIPKDSLDEDTLFLQATELGAEDFEALEEVYVITTTPENFLKVKDGLNAEGELEMIPKTWVECTPENATANRDLIDWLENSDDVDAVFHNMKEE